jgi:hypothetical protein
VKDINLNGSPVTLYLLCVIAAALEKHGEVTIRGVAPAKQPKTSSEWLAEIEHNPHRRLNGDL